MELYGAGLERLLELAHEAGALGDALLDALAADDLVASLLLVHGLHPYGVQERVERALDGVRPYLGSHGGDVRLLGVSPDGVVRLQLLGSCDGCASSAVTLELAVEDAVRSAAPEVVRIEVQAGSRPGRLIPVRGAHRPAAPGRAVRRGAVGPGRRARPTCRRGRCCAPAPAVSTSCCAGCRRAVYAYRDRCGGCGAELRRGRAAALPRQPRAAPC